MKIDPIRLMRWAEDVASDSTCAKIQVGAVLVTPRGQVFSTGFNGTPPGHIHCKTVFASRKYSEDEFLRLHAVFSEQSELHAEFNSIIHAPQDKLKESILFTTWSPCFHCAKLILTVGISKVYYRNVYKQEAIDHLSRFIEMEQV